MRFPSGDELYLYSPCFLTFTQVPVAEPVVFFENGVPFEPLPLTCKDGSFVMTIPDPLLLRVLAFAPVDELLVFVKTLCVTVSSLATYLTCF